MYIVFCKLPFDVKYCIRGRSPGFICTLAVRFEDVRYGSKSHCDDCGPDFVYCVKEGDGAVVLIHFWSILYSSVRIPVNHVCGNAVSMWYANNLPSIGIAQVSNALNIAWVCDQPRRPYSFVGVVLPVGFRILRYFALARSGIFDFPM